MNMNFSVNVFGGQDVMEYTRHEKLVVGCTIHIDLNTLGGKSVDEISMIREFIDKYYYEVSQFAFDKNAAVIDCQFGEMNPVETIAELASEWQYHCSEFKNLMDKHNVQFPWELKLNISTCSHLLED